MEGIPFHPAVVHLPLGIAFVVPLAMVAVLIAWLGGWLPRTAWAVVIVLQVLLVVGGLVAMDAGEDEEERVERVLDKKLIHEHEEKAEAFVWASGFALALSAVVLLLRSETNARRTAMAATAAALIVVALAYRVGHSGGELVYVHGAARAYTNGP